MRLDYTFSGKYNLDGDHWQGGFWGKQIYEFRNNRRTPLTATCGIVQYKPDNHFFTDLGSVPLTLQYSLPKWFAKDRYIRAYIFHDSAYKHGGVWVCINGKWTFRNLTRKQADDMLYHMLIAEGASKANARAIWLGVRAGGWYSWGKTTQNPQ